MEKMINLRHLLMHEVQDLTSAEEQIIEALPAMIKKANNKSLKKTLEDHLKVTEAQLERLEQVKQLLNNEEGGEEEPEGNNKGIFGGLFGGNGHTCKGMEGLIKEGNKVMGENMTPQVMDAAIIASAQKIEHYEICGYGTARAYARELNLGEVAELLEETLNEEYQADDLLTDLAVGKLNEKAEAGSRSNGASRKSRGSGNKSNGAAKKASSSRSNGSARSKSASNKGRTGTRTNKSSKSGNRANKGARSRSRSK